MLKGKVVSREQLAAALFKHLTPADANEKGEATIDNVFSFMGLGDEFIVTEESTVMKGGKWIPLMPLVEGREINVIETDNRGAA